MALLPGHIQYSPVFVWLFSFLVFLLTSGKCRSCVIEWKVKSGFILLFNFFNSVNKSLAAQVHCCECNVKFFFIGI